MKHVKLIEMMKPFLRYFMLKNQAAWFVKSFWGHNSRTRFFHDTPFSKKLGRPLVLSCSEKNFARRNNISKKTRKFSFLAFLTQNGFFTFQISMSKKNQKKLMNIKVNDVCKSPTSTIITICWIIFLKLTFSWWTKNLRKSNLINHWVFYFKNNCLHFQFDINH